MKKVLIAMLAAASFAVALPQADPTPGQHPPAQTGKKKPADGHKHGRHGKQGKKPAPQPATPAPQP